VRIEPGGGLPWGILVAAPDVADELLALVRPDTPT
jgi:hypothetical protein